MARNGAAIREMVAAAARALNEQLPDRTHELEEVFLEQIPEVRGDEAIQELMVASTAANLSVMFDALQHGIDIASLDVPAAAAAYAQRFAQRGLPLEALLRAYRLGDHRFIQWFLQALSERSRSPAELVQAANRVVTFTVEYVDKISEALIGIYREERRLWGQRTDAARAAQVRAVLHDSAMDETTAEIMTGHAMGHWHVGVVTWVDTDHPDPERLVEDAARRLRGAGTPAPLVVPTDAHTLWAWCSAPTRGDPVLGAYTSLVEAAPEVRVAVGEPARGLVGFRTTHREALRARSVAETALPAAPLTRFGEVRLSALMAENLDDVRAWVARTLGELARDDEDMARLRETVRTFLETGGSATETAKRLHVHRNTVRYRVRKAEEVRGRALSDDRIDVEVSLLTCEQLGASVLLPPAV